MQHVITQTEQDQRLDAACAAILQIPRAQVQRWIETGNVLLNGARARASKRVHCGDILQVQPVAAEPLEVNAEEIALSVLYEDEDLIVIDKPAGLVVHPAPGHSHSTLVNALLHHCRGGLSGIGGVQRPGIVHRLDRGTSGVLVVAKNDLAHQSLSDQFRLHSIERVYWALVRGIPKNESGEIERPIGRHARDRKKMSVRTKSGRAAHTVWKVKKRFTQNRVTLLEIRPKTGRTHQIRVHLAAAGLPLVGDSVYGRANSTNALLERPALHAKILGFEHPRTGERKKFEADLPNDFQSLIDALSEKEQ